jgi:hypothetical protein
LQPESGRALIAATVNIAGVSDVLSWSVEDSSDLLGRMWAVIATVFVFKDTSVCPKLVCRNLALEAKLHKSKKT